MYCRAEGLARAGGSLTQLLRGLDGLPVPLDVLAIVVSDNADLYGTFADLRERAEGTEAGPCS